MSNRLGLDVDRYLAAINARDSATLTSKGARCDSGEVARISTARSIVPASADAFYVGDWTGDRLCRVFILPILHYRVEFLRSALVLMSRFGRESILRPDS